MVRPNRQEGKPAVPSANDFAVILKRILEAATAVALIKLPVGMSVSSALTRTAAFIEKTGTATTADPVTRTPPGKRCASEPWPRWNCSWPN